MLAIDSEDSRAVFPPRRNNGPSGGAHFLMGDGRGIFLNDNMDFRVFAVLNYIHDKQAVGDF